MMMIIGNIMIHVILMNIEEMLEINDCPLCDGGGLLEEECGCGYYVMCLECGCHSVTIDFHSEEERLDAAKKTVMLWNTGKVIEIAYFSICQ